ncbi:hypothetical protein [Methylobacterium indicum]|uniref:Uncharacterized protein n=1 Tax=Methylobacterium indicum TaxID=1775910 RepID=A0A8H9C9E9_9HYPH|nr:hypothetical protein [Methylobacterium indicum]BCM88082.1 hypothetical protein mvi_65430 [Methylobacterium indicum]
MDDLDPAVPTDDTEINVNDIAVANFGEDGSGDLPDNSDVYLPDTILDIDIGKIISFLHACENSHPRVKYKLGAKIKPGQEPGAGGFTEVDCSGFVRECVRRATNLGSRFPDGSVVQHEWVRKHGFPIENVSSGSHRDGAVRIAFLPPNKSKKRVGHVAFIHDGKTIESHGGVGPDSRPWDGRGWQANTNVYLLRPAHFESEESVLEIARSHREALEWLDENAALLENSPLSFRSISERAIALIVYFEVTDRSTYERKYERPIWPGEKSGVTIGIGYDVGYTTIAQLRTDWKGLIPDQMIKEIEKGVGVKGKTAQALAKELGSKVSIPWSAADTVFRKRDIPRWTSLVESALPNTKDLSADSMGALVSLAYNRGASFSSPNDRYREMRAIRSHMVTRQFSLIPGEILSMKRLWPNNKGLRHRRDLEAKLFQDGLKDFEVTSSSRGTQKAMADVGALIREVMHALTESPQQLKDGRKFFFPNGIGEIDVQLDIGGSSAFSVHVDVKGAEAPSNNTEKPIETD